MAYIAWVAVAVLASCVLTYALYLIGRDLDCVLDDCSGFYWAADLLPVAAAVVLGGSMGLTTTMPRWFASILGAVVGMPLALMTGLAIERSDVPTEDLIAGILVAAVMAAPSIASAALSAWGGRALKNRSETKRHVETSSS